MIEHILVSILFDLTRATLLSLRNTLTYSNVNVLRNDNNVARVKSKRIETSICSIINIKLSTPIFGRPMHQLERFARVCYKVANKLLSCKTF